jgi:hypothetical protein
LGICGRREAIPPAANRHAFLSVIVAVISLLNYYSGNRVAPVIFIIINVAYPVNPGMYVYIPFSVRGIIALTRSITTKRARNMVAGLIIYLTPGIIGG